MDYKKQVELPACVRRPGLEVTGSLLLAAVRARLGTAPQGERPVSQVLSGVHTGVASGLMSQPCSVHCRIRAPGFNQRGFKLGVWG